MCNLIKGILVVICFYGFAFTGWVIARTNTRDEFVTALIATAVPFLISTVALVGVGVMQAVKEHR